LRSVSSGSSSNVCNVNNNGNANNNSATNTTAQQNTDTWNRLPPNQASATPPTSASHAETGLWVAESMAGKVITARVT
jgi:hypothetical protein